MAQIIYKASYTIKGDSRDYNDEDAVVDIGYFLSKEEAGKAYKMIGTKNPPEIKSIVVYETATEKQEIIAAAKTRLSDVERVVLYGN